MQVSAAEATVAEPQPRRLYVDVDASAGEWIRWRTKRRRKCISHIDNDGPKMTMMTWRSRDDVDGYYTSAQRR